MNALIVVRLASDLSEPPGDRTPIRGIFVVGWARPLIGQAAAPPINVMNSRRLIAIPEPQDQASYQPKVAH